MGTTAMAAGGARDPEHAPRAGALLQTRDKGGGEAKGGAIAHLGPTLADDLMDAPAGQPPRAEAAVDGVMAKVKIGVAPRVRRRRPAFKAPDTLFQFRQNRRVITFFLN